MFSHAVIFAALSAGALAGHGWTPNKAPAVFATAFPPSDTDCTGASAGNNVSLSVNLQQKRAGADLLSSCITYAPKHAQNIKLDYPDDPDVYFFVYVYSDPGCKNETGQLSGWEGEPRCLPMAGGSSQSLENEGTEDWQSVQLQILN